MSPREVPALSYPERLATFEGYWSDNEATARQLAATGHVYDRPPLEALEEGSRCISCAAFAARDSSVKILEGPVGLAGGDYSHHNSKAFSLHQPRCIYLQSRIPWEIRTEASATVSRFGDLKNRFETLSRYQPSRPMTPKPASVPAASQTSLFFSLPTELRLEIYSYILPTLEATTSIRQLNLDSGRIVTLAGLGKIGRRDTTKINVLSTCHVIYEEAIDLIYSNVTYQFDSSKVLYNFLRYIGHRGRQLLKSIDLVCGTREDAITLALLASCPKLKSIVLRFTRPWLVYQTAPIWILDGVACLLQISGLESVTLAAVDGAPRYLSASYRDGQMIERELKRPRGQEGSIRWVNGTIDV